MADTSKKVADVAKEKVENLTATVKDKTESLTSTASKVAGDVKEKAQDAASAAVQKTEETLSNVGGKMTTLADTIREKAPEGALGTAATTVADRLQAGGQYLQQHDLEDMAEDFGAVVRRYPMQSILIGFGLGFLLGQAFSRR